MMEKVAIGLLIPITLLFLLVTIFTLFFAVQVPFWLELLPLGLSVIFLGIPHGALDILVPDLLYYRQLDWNRRLLFIAAYLFVMGVVFLFWRVTPLLSFILFIFLTWWHWGSGELQTLQHFYGMNFLKGGGGLVLTAVVRGAFPMVLPFVFFPETYLQVANAMVGLFQLSQPLLTTELLTPLVRVSVLLIFVVFLVALEIITFLRIRDPLQWRAWLIFTVENGVLFLFFAVVPAYLAVGLYFCLWHALRHMLRLAMLDESARTSLVAGNLLQPFWRLTVKGAAMSFLAILILVATFFLIPNRPDNSVAIIALYLAVIAALTAPHAIVVGWMDSIQEIW